MSISLLKQSFVKKYLEPGESLGEIVFGLIMVLTFTLGAGRTAPEGEEGVRELLIAAIGCNVAWGIIDGVIYIMNSLFDRSSKTRMIQSLQKNSDEKETIKMIQREYEPRLVAVTTEEERDRLYKAIFTMVSRSKAEKTRVTKEDIYGAIACFWLVFITAFPAAIPFFFFSDPIVGLRVSNFLLVAMLFIVGYSWAKYTNANPLLAGLSLMLIGVVLVGVAIALGG